MRMRRSLRSIVYVFLFPCLLLGQKEQEKLPYILNLAIQQRGDNLEKYERYSAEFIETCRADISAIPFSIWLASGVFIPDKKDTGVVYRSQALIEAKYYDNFHYSQVVKVKREAGRLPIPNWHQLPAYGFSLLQDRIYLNQTFARGFISPLSNEGLKIYNYQLKDSAMADGLRIFEVNFAPRKEKYPGLSGSVWLIDSIFLPLKASFKISANNQLELMDSICLRQEYSWQNGDYKMLSQEIQLHINLFGYRGAYYIDHEFSKFQYSPDLEKDDFTGLAYYQSKREFNLDTSFWQSLSNENQYQKYYDSLGVRTSLDKQFRMYGSHRLDPVKQLNYKYLYRGFTIRKNYWYLDLPAVYRSLGFNAVEGPYAKYVFKAGHIKDQKEWSFQGQLRYGFADRRLKPSFSLMHNINFKQAISFNLTGGSDYRQLNEDEPILPVLNTAYNLLLATNYINLFGKDYLALELNTEPRKGFAVSTRLEYANRYPLFNKSSFSFINSKADYHSNNDNFSENISPEGFEKHQALTLELNLSYQFKQLYEVRYSQRFQELYEGRKNLQQLAPKLYFDFRMGIPTAFSSTNYLFQRIGIQNSFRWGNIGLSQFDISAGGFLYSESVPFIDYQHFDGVQIFFLQPSADRSAMIKQFSSLPYYNYSTNQSFIELHYEHSFDGALLSKINFIRPYKVHSLVGFNSLHLKDRRAFIEVFFGLDNIFKILRIEFVAGIDNFTAIRPSLRIGFDFNYDYYKRNR
jgi:hypothetical protein